MFYFPRVESCPDSRCVSGSDGMDLFGPLDMANHMMQMAIEDFAHSREDYSEIVHDINRIPACVGSMTCRRYEALLDALREMNVLDLLGTQIEGKTWPSSRL